MTTHETQPKTLPKDRTMTKNTKTPAEAVAAAEKALQNAKLRAAKEIAQSNPLMTEIQGKIDALTKEIAGYSRQTSGHNSFENRLTAARLHYERIQAEEQLTIARNIDARNRKELLQTAMNEIAERIANGDDTSNLAYTLPTSSDLSSLEDAFAEADRRWRESTPAALKKASQNVAPSVSDAMEAGD